MKPFWGWASIIMGSLLLLFRVVVDGERCSSGSSASSFLFDIRTNGGMKYHQDNECGGFGGDCTGSNSDDLEESEEEENEWQCDPVGFGFKEKAEDDQGEGDCGDDNNIAEEEDNGMVREDLPFFEEGRMKARINWARKTINHYTREARGRFSSELEQIALKATRPDDNHVKSKHLEALLKPSYEMPKEVNVYKSSLKKLWGKMAETDWRTVIKSLYILHRFAQDGCVAQNTNLKNTIVALKQRTDPKCNVPYFDIDTTCAVLSPPWVDEDVLPYSNFIKRYAEYVFHRVAWFGPGFSELLESADGYAMLQPVWTDKVQWGSSIPSTLSVAINKHSWIMRTAASIVDVVAGVFGSSTSSFSYGVGGGSYSCFAAVKELISAGLRCRGRSVSGEIIQDAVVAISRDLHDIMEASSAQLDWLRRHPLPPSAVNHQFSDLDEEDEDNANEVVEEAISDAQEYWAELDKWKHLLESRLKRITSYISSVNELVVASSSSSTSVKIRTREGRKCVASLTIAPRVLGRWQRREEKRQRSINRQQKNLQSFASLIIWLLSRPNNNNQCCTATTRTRTM